MLLKPIVYKLFRGEGPEQDLAMAGHSKGARYVPWFIRLLVFFAVFFFHNHWSICYICAWEQKSAVDEFYALFYLGLFAEVRGEPEKAQAYMRRAVQTEYANWIGRGDYMTACARVSYHNQSNKQVR